MQIGLWEGDLDIRFGQLLVDKHIDAVAMVKDGLSKNRLLPIAS
jgi:uncharacterized protein (DUF305 family)